VFWKVGLNHFRLPYSGSQAHNFPDYKLAHVPGTVLLDDEAAHSEDTTHGLKHGTGKNSHIVLSPQPSEDPNDPLNWPMWKKDMIIAILCLGTMLNAGTNVSFFLAHELADADLTRGHFSMPLTSSSPNRSENRSQSLFLSRATISLRQAALDPSFVPLVENMANDLYSWPRPSLISSVQQSANLRLAITTFSQHASSKVSPPVPLSP
jgi:hypothetical protein